MAKRGFIFTNRKHSQRGIFAAILGGINLVSLGAAVFLAYRRGGSIGEKYGATGLLVFVFAIGGLILGIRTLREKEYFGLFPWLGIITNSLALLGIGVLLYGGMV